MPQGNSRYGESYKCDSSDKFVKPASADYSMMKENEIYVFSFKTANDFVNTVTGTITATKLLSTWMARFEFRRKLNFLNCL